MTGASLRRLSAMNESRETPSALAYVAPGARLAIVRVMDHDQYAAGWGTLTLINAGLAQGKGRSGLAWFLVSVFLGPIATLLIVLMPSVEQQNRR